MSPSKVSYNKKLQIWSGDAYGHTHYIHQSVGGAFLKLMRSIDQAKILEYHYDIEEERSAGRIYTKAVSVALNLRRLGVQKGDVVILHMANVPEASPLTMGAYLLGAVVNFSDFKLSEDMLKELFEKMQPTALFYGTEFRDALKKLVRETTSLKVSLPVNVNAKEPNVHTELFRPSSPEEIKMFQACPIDDPAKETCCLVLTSGSTGIPKLVELSHAFMLHCTVSWWPELPNDSVLFSFSPLRWISQIGILHQSLLLGLKRICVTRPPSGSYGVEIIRSTKITHMFSAPGIYTNILKSVADDDITSLASIRFIFLGGEPPSEAVLQMARKKSPKSKVYNSYGMTETAGLLTLAEQISGGVIIPGLEVKILDDQRIPQGPGVPGQIAIRLPIPILGYMKEDATHKFTEDGFFVNGDYGYIDDGGKLHMNGRYEDLIKTEKITIVPATIESMVSLLPEIREACLVPLHMEHYSNDIGVLFVVLAKESQADEDALKVKIRETIHKNLKSTEAALLQDIHFVESLPLTTCGKTDRVALRKYAGDLRERMRAMYAQFRKDIECLDG